MTDQTASKLGVADEEEETTCQSCDYAYPADNGRGKMILECRRYPPQLHLFMVPPRLQGQTPNVIKQSDFPNCSGICGEYQETLVAYKINGGNDE